MTRIAPLEVKLRGCDEQREDVSVGLKENLTELQGYFGGTGGTAGRDPPGDDSCQFSGGFISWLVEAQSGGKPRLFLPVFIRGCQQHRGAEELRLFMFIPSF